MTLIRKIIKKIFGQKNQIEILRKRGLITGENFNIMEGCIIDDSHCWHIEIGNNVTLAPRVHILAHDASTKMFLNYTKVKNVKIGSNVFIGAGSIILPGANIGSNVIIGAGSIVRDVVPDNAVYAGNPARIVCTLDTYLSRVRLKMDSGNMFGEDFTLRQNVDSGKKEMMKRIIQEKGIGFVI